MWIGILRAGGWGLVSDISIITSAFFFNSCSCFCNYCFPCALCWVLWACWLAGLPKACLPGHGDASCIIMAAGVL